MPDLSIRLPEVTFDGRLCIHGSDRAVELIAFENCHTANDTILYLPADGVLFMSDLLFVDSHPFLPDGDPENLLSTLEQFSNFDATTLVPGHGPSGTKDDLKLMAGYIHDCRAIVENMHQNGQQEAAIGERAIPEPYQAWDFAIFYPANLRYYYRRFGASDD